MLKKLPEVFQRGFTILYSHQQFMRVLGIYMQNLLLPVFLILALLAIFSDYLIVSICISLMTNIHIFGMY